MVVYTEGLRGLMAEGGSKRVEAAKQAFGSVGGSLEAFYFAFGDNDFYIIVDLPDNVSTTAVTLAGNVSGTFSIKTVVLLTPEEIDRAVRKSVDFRHPAIILGGILYRHFLAGMEIRLTGSWYRHIVGRDSFPPFFRQIRKALVGQAAPDGTDAGDAHQRFFLGDNQG